MIQSLRSLRRTPIVTTIAALSLGLGIGSNAAIYSMFHRMVRQDLDVVKPERLVNLSANAPRNGSTSTGMAGGREYVFSYPMLRDLQRSRPASVSAIVGHRTMNANVSVENRSWAEEGMLVSGDYFATLGVQPAAGRLIAPADDAAQGGTPVVVLGHDFWQTRLGGDPGLVGKSMTVNGTPLTIIGVAPDGFDGTTYGEKPSYYVPFAMAATVGSGTERRHEDRRAWYIYVFARLAPGASMQEAETALNAVYQPIIREVEVPLQRNMADSVLARFAAQRITLENGSRGQSEMQSEAGKPILLLFAITGLVLLIACANIANLLMARATSREMEMAVRLSLGATRRRLLAQLFGESLALALLGGLVSLVFASWTLKGIMALLPPEISGTLDLRLNWVAVAFAGIVSIVTGLVFGLFPAIHSTRPDLVTAMRNNSGKLAGGKAARRFRTSLATAQIALAMALLMSAGLFLKSLWKISRVDAGVAADRLITFSLSPSQSGYDTARVRALFTQVETELAGLPGATGVTSAIVPLLANSNWTNSVRVEGYKPESNASSQASFNAVGSNHFRTIGVDLLAGREFTDADAGGRPRVAIVNETFARRFNLGANPVGKRLAQGSSDTIPLNIEIVGLVRDAKYSNVKREIPPVFFVPHRQQSHLGEMNFYVRTEGDPRAMLRGAAAVAQRIDPMLPVEGLRTLPEEIRRGTFEDRMISTLSSSFALLATLLAAMGLYGVLAYSVAQRTREIGVRMALGAAAPQVRRLVMRQVGKMTLIGATIGLAFALALGKVAEAMLYQMSGSDPFVIGSATILLALVALGAGYVPALRASRVDPIQALRYE